MVDEETREAQVIVPDYQLSLAIGKEGQNARLAARLTGYKIDIKNETQAREMGLFEELGLDDHTEEGVYEEYADSYDGYGEAEPEEGYPEDAYEEDGYEDGAADPDSQTEQG